MYKRQRNAIDGDGQPVAITERQDSDEPEFREDGSRRCCMPAKFYAPDGQRLVPDSDGWLRTALGAKYQLTGTGQTESFHRDQSGRAYLDARRRS